MKRQVLSLFFGLMICIATLSARAQVLGANDKPIHDVARMGSGAEVQAILAKTMADRDARTGLGSTPLHLAATNPDISALKALIAAGADVNARDNDGATPLHMAAYTQRAAHARLLLEAGADTTLKTHVGRDPMSMARKNMANEVAGVISLWILKGCKASQPC
jgi:uncharacterized protein